MCGISGEYRFDQTHADLRVIDAINQRQSSRGPDAAGLFSQNRLALGHRRLKIMDLSAESQQPMFDPYLGLALVFNGAIYNYPELREELRVLGYSFYSDGDTEVVLKAFHAWGMDCLKRFNGMFAFAIWRQRDDSLFLARDRLGIKPLYFVAHPRFFRFTSNLTALLHSPDVSRDLNPKALHYYLHFHSVVPAPETLFSAIQKLPPGHCLEISATGEQRLQQWWSLSFGPAAGDLDKPVETWRDELLEQLYAAVRRRNRAAVDVGVLLSGGVDSSLLVGLLSEISNQGFATFSIGFESVGAECGDEFRYSDLIATQFGSEHHRLKISENELLDALPAAIAAMAEPMVSHDCVGFYLLSREVAKSRRVVQSGQGADEIFGGYHWYPPLLTSQNPLQTYRAAFFDRSFQEYQATLQPQWQTPDYAEAFVAQHFADAGAAHPVDKALRLDTKVMLIDDPVKRVDNMTMAHGLEARVPFLDHELVEFAARIPAELKVKGDGKWLLKEAARQVIPAAVIDRPKGYFPVPALKYLRGRVLDRVKHALDSPAAKARDLFKPTYLQTLLAEPAAHLTPLRGSKLWQLGLLELWLQTQNV